MSDPLVSMTGMSKRYAGTQALDNVNFHVREAEIVGLLGKNGAGKSTLIKMLAGLVHADEGEIAFNGETAHKWGQHEAAAAGFHFVFQELEEFADLTVAENVLIGSTLPKSRLGLVSERLLNKEAGKHLERVRCNVSPRALMGTLTMVQRRQVMIARSLAGQKKLLVLDEPTAALTAREVDLVLNLCQELRASGVAIVYVSHRLSEVLAIADRVVILQDGKNRVERVRAELDLESLIHDVAGTTTKLSVKPALPPSVHTQEPIVSASNISDGRRFFDVTFDLRPGECLGIGGLVGAGRSELVEALAGDRKLVTGTLKLNGKPVKFGTIADALNAGLVLLPEERRSQGVISEYDIQSNATLSSLGLFGRRALLSVISKKRERATVAPLMKKLQLKSDGLGQLVGTLSGGNQQKVLMARAVMTGCRIVIMDEPTAGIDVQAREEIYKLVDDLKADGTALIVISSEFSELVRMSDRVLVLSEGRQAALLEGVDVDEDHITRLCYSHARTVA